MKFVTLILVAMALSLGASAQTTHRTTAKSAVAINQQKSKRGKLRPGINQPAAATAETISLTDEKAHKAKWTFEEMLQRRLDIDAAEGVTQRGRE